MFQKEHYLITTMILVFAFMGAPCSECIASPSASGNYNAAQATSKPLTVPHSGGCPQIAFPTPTPPSHLAVPIAVPTIAPVAVSVTPDPSVPYNTPNVLWSDSAGDYLQFRSGGVEISLNGKPTVRKIKLPLTFKVRLAQCGPDGYVFMNGIAIAKWYIGSAPVNGAGGSFAAFKGRLVK